MMPRVVGSHSRKERGSSILVVTGSLCLLITLGLAWCLVGVQSSSFMKRLFPNYQNLLKAHLDYLMMTGLPMIFFLLFNQFRVSPSPLVVFAMCVGSFMNPVGFIALAIKRTFASSRPARSAPSWRAALA